MFREEVGRPASVWVVDFEYRLDGQLQLPVCMCATHLETNENIRLWRDELATSPFANPYVMVAFNAAAEIHCYARLGWEMPGYVLDLFQEHKLEHNAGKDWRDKVGKGLQDALRANGLPNLVYDGKEAMRKLILESSPPELDQQRERVLDYCQTDVDATLALLLAMLPRIDLRRAIGFRGRYMRAVGRIEHEGTPFDRDTYEDLVKYLPKVREELIKDVDAEFNIFGGGLEIKKDLFATFLKREGLLSNWEKTAGTGRVSLDKNYLEKRAVANPKIRTIYELKSVLSAIKTFVKPVVTLHDENSKHYAPSSDGRIRASLWAFGTSTGRNAPKSSQFLFGASKVWRGLIKPPPGYAVAYLDWGGQEAALAAGQSNDEAMTAGYLAGDLYLDFAIRAGAIPPGGTKETHGAERGLFKAVTLGMSYGQRAPGIAVNANIPLVKAQEIFDHHKRTYPTYHAWIEGVKLRATWDSYISTRYGWKLKVLPSTKPLTIQNFPMQATGAHCMQAAAILAVEAGLNICCPVHDAFLLVAPLDRIEADVATLKDIMVDVGRQISGLTMKVDAKITRFPDRYVEDRGADLWVKMLALVAAEKARTRGATL